ncbi:MAG: ribonuclease PH [Acidobacteria bacterium]|nr:MAG: ribonuclease PH [Acidobacteriota bacterium]
MKRRANRQNDALRKVEIIPGFQLFPAGSVLISFGRTRVICSATIEEKVPPFLKDRGLGWVTAEYSMLPAATGSRNMRESVKGKQQGRSVEIQRLIGRSLRAVVDRQILGERSILIDCDVIQADGGTRTASITGAYVALSLAVEQLMRERAIQQSPILSQVAAVSVGMVNGEVLLDLDYPEDSNADVDMNIVATSEGTLIEIQGTAEGAPFSRDKMDQMLDIGLEGIEKLMVIQRQALNQ